MVRSTTPTRLISRETRTNREQSQITHRRLRRVWNQADSVRVGQQGGRSSFAGWLHKDGSCNMMSLTGNSMSGRAPMYDSLLANFDLLRKRTARFRRVALHIHSPDSHDWARGAPDAARNQRSRFDGDSGLIEFCSELKPHLDMAGITDHMRCSFATRLSSSVSIPDEFCVLPGMEVNLVSTSTAPAPADVAASTSRNTDWNLSFSAMDCSSRVCRSILRSDRFCQATDILSEAKSYVSDGRLVHEITFDVDIETNVLSDGRLERACTS